MNSIDGYFETPWVAIDIEQIVSQLAEFDLRYRNASCIIANFNISTVKKNNINTNRDEFWYRSWMQVQ